MFFQISEATYIKNPISSALGRSIIAQSIVLIDELGLEDFTFKKLAEAIKSTEASVYRYFENKHQLLVFLTNWYWHWMKSRIMEDIVRDSDPSQKLTKALLMLTNVKAQDDRYDFVNEQKLHRILISEGLKVYHNKHVDVENEEGYFKSQKNLLILLSDLISDVNASYPFPHSLASTILAACHQQLFFSHHLPLLSDVDKQNTQQLNQFIKQLTFAALKNDAT